MADSRGWALICDSNPERFALLQGVLEDEFLTTAENVENFEELQAEFGKRPWRLILVAHDFPLSPSRRSSILAQYFYYLNVHAIEVPKAFVIPADEPEDLQLLTPRPQTIHAESAAPAPGRRKQLATEIGTLIPRASRLPEVVLADSPSLREQVRRLNERRDLEGGRHVLSHLLRDLFDWGVAEVGRLGQGASGAKVFRVRPSGAGDGAKEYFLKLSPSADFWKIRLEVEKHAAARQRLGVEDYSIHFVKLVAPRVKNESPEHGLEEVVSYGNWHAVCYDFLGESEFGKFIDLETAIVAPAGDLAARTRGTRYEADPPDATAVLALRHRLFETALEWLTRNWYAKEGVWRRETRALWETVDTPDSTYPVMPPYQLAGKSKAFVLSFLDSNSAKLGERFFDGWAEYRRSVWGLVERGRGATGAPLLDRELSVVLSPAHGDMNANNLLLWLDRPEHPFLIDFPFFQEAGHALQDFARLEVEIKLALMDRQADSPPGELQALDYTYTQVALWKEMEDHLLSPDWQRDKTDWAAGAYTANVNFCLGLVRGLRVKALEVQRQGGAAAPDFLAEYLPALLYHTVRAVGYDTLSIFKRLLSVYSAGRILRG
ncbi:MAG TPA: hypothetical protein VF736_04775 [Pyrinomonadaceae bacterium]|jgi:hypothetical protein